MSERDMIDKTPSFPTAIVTHVNEYVDGYGADTGTPTLLLYPGVADADRASRRVDGRSVRPVAASDAPRAAPAGGPLLANAPTSPVSPTFHQATTRIDCRTGAETDVADRTRTAPIPETP